jgi:hypothetical protein
MNIFAPLGLFFISRADHGALRHVRMLRPVTIIMEEVPRARKDAESLPQWQ